PAPFAAFARAAVEPYAPRGVKALEIWNEPNLTFYGMPAPDPPAYAAFLGAAHDAIKAAEPTSAVITGGLAPAENQPRSQAMNPLLHLRAVYRAGGGKFDALGYHPYTYPAMLTDDRATARSSPRRRSCTTRWPSTATGRAGVGHGDGRAHTADRAADVRRAVPHPGVQPLRSVDVHRPLIWFSYLAP